MHNIFLKTTIITIALLLIPFVAMHFYAEVQWGVEDFAFAAVILWTFGFIFLRFSTSKSNFFFKAAMGVFLLNIALLIWISLAVGIFGEPDLLEFLPSLFLGGFGAVIVKFRAASMVYVSLSLAGLQTLIGIFALINQAALSEIWYGEVLLNGFFVFMFLTSAVFFKKSKK